MTDVGRQRDGGGVQDSGMKIIRASRADQEEQPANKQGVIRKGRERKSPNWHLHWFRVKGQALLTDGKITKF